jgi:CBS domain-containing protein
MSPRAASRLETLGFNYVFDYVAGKADWGSFGLPLEGTNGSETRAGANVRTDVPTCGPDDRLHDVCDLLDASGWNTCFVVDDGRVVLGRLGRRAIRERTDITASEAMTLGPSTVRPSARLEEMVDRMRRQNLTSLPVTRSDGVLVGLVLRDEAERALARRGAETLR